MGRSQHHLKIFCLLYTSCNALYAIIKFSGTSEPDARMKLSCKDYQYSKQKQRFC